MDKNQSEVQSSGEVVSGMDIGDLPRTTDGFFRTEEFRFKGRIISSPFASAIFDNISTSDLSQQCKLEFYKVLAQAFDSNAMLARNKNMEVRYIDLDIVLNLMIIGCHESDIQNPAFLTIQENIKQAFRDFASPSEGGKARDDIQKIQQKVEYTGLPEQRQQGGMQPQQQPMQPQRGLRRFGGGENR